MARIKATTAIYAILLTNSFALEMPPNCSEPFICPINGKNITDPITNEGECFVACVTCQGSNWMCANFLNKTSVNRTGNFDSASYNSNNDGEEDNEMMTNAINATNIEEFFECQCGLMSGGACSSWMQVCVDEGFDEVFDEVEKNSIDMDESLRNHS